MSRSAVEGLANNAKPEQGVTEVVRELLKEQSELGTGEVQGRTEQLGLSLKIGGEGRFRSASGNVALWSGPKASEGS